jgi:ribosomal protein S18 acetylase RimI-like enzyme
MNLKVQEYTLQDKKHVKDFILETWKEFPDYYYDAARDYDLDDPQQYYIKGGGMFYVIKDGNRVVGTIGVVNTGNKRAELKRLYVAKEYRGYSFGSQLIDTAIAFCQKNDFSIIEFETDKIFEKAHMLYIKRGFKIVKETEYSYFMEKTL